MNIFPIFSTPLWNLYYPDYENDKDNLLGSLSDIIEEYELNKDENILKDIHSKEEFHHFFSFVCYISNTACDELNFNKNRNVFITSSSLNVNKCDKHSVDDLNSHKHTFTGIFYLKTNKENNSLSFLNDSINLMWNGLELCQNKNQYITKKLEVSPEQGQVIFWPSFLKNTIQQDDDTISVSFNILILPESNK